MHVHRHQATRSKPALLLWVLAALALGAATLGLVHVASVRRVRVKVDAQPVRPVVVIDFSKESDSEPWQSAATELGRELVTHSGASLADIPAKRFAAWVLVEPPELSAAEFAALDSYLQLGGGAVVIGGSRGRAE